MINWVEGNSENGYGKAGILLKGGHQRVLSVVKIGDDIQFREECDGVYCETFTKEEALKVIDELKEWING